MMWWYPGMAQFGWTMMLVNGLITVLIWVGLIALAVWAVRAITGRSGGDHEPLEILRRRFAAGEISEEQYEQAKRALQR